MIENGDLKGEIAFLEEQKTTGATLIDSLHFSRKGKLRFTLNLKQPTFYTVRIPKGPDIFLLVFPGDKITVKASNTNPLGIEITGSPESEKMNVLYDSLFATRKILEPIRNEYYATEIPAVRDSLYNQYVKVLNGYRRFSLQFVLENLNSLTSIAALYQETAPEEYVFSKLKDMQYFKIVSDSLIKYFPNHPHVKALQKNFNQMHNSFQLERIKASAKNVGEGIPNLFLPNPKGDTITLAGLKYKYILLNFWSDNDQVTQDFFPVLKKVSKNYLKKDFTIYNVYVGKSIDMWKRIIKFEGIEDWINVADTAFPDSKSRTSYNITELPTNYLIDLKEKSILIRDISDEQLDNFLKQTIK